MCRRLALLLVSVGLVACGDDGGSIENTNLQNQNQPVCGNGIVETGEQCDAAEQNSDSEPNACRSNCRTAYCGDSVIDDAEECDLDSLSGQTCESLGLGYNHGTLTCSATCVLDTSQCFVCGDGVVDTDETCDGTNLAGATCVSLTGLQSGTPTCTDTCGYDTSPCHTCGNDLREGPEVCDGNSLGDVTCASLGHDGGLDALIVCEPNCGAAVGYSSFEDYSACFECGDGLCYLSRGETSANCHDDCCGDGVCDPSEDAASCGQDCYCGDGVCDALEDGTSCWGDCHCGNGRCDGGENATTCAADCFCGNSTCEVTETPALCAADCYCGNGTCELTETTALCAADCPGTRQVDLLLVVDSSGTMAEEQALLQAQVSSVLQGVETALGDKADLHLGITTPDLGSGVYPDVCGSPEGDGGRLLSNGCANPQGASWVVDVAPVGCTIDRDPGGACTSHDCTAASCSQEASTTLVTDASGCPRCVNYTSVTLPDVVSCMIGLGTTGCDFEQPLEAMYLALDAHPANQGFLRDDAVLAVVFLTSKDDCSASDPELFDSTQSDLNSELGPLTTFRCFEFGVTCDVNSRTALGVRHDCIPRTDPGAMLHPVYRYSSFLLGLRQPGRLVVAAVAGPTQAGAVTVGLDAFSLPAVQDSCVSANGGATPGIRLQAFLEQLTDPAQMSWAYTSVCQTSYASTLEAIGTAIGERLQ